MNPKPAIESTTFSDQAQVSFESISKEIIKKSIKSAVCIDDMFVQPYMSDQEIFEIEDSFDLDKEGNRQFLNRDIPRSLYQSFRIDGECDLDIYHFKSYEESWKPNIILNNKDLLVIDWELDKNQGHHSTLKIIEEVIISDKVPFIIIYTHKPIEDFIEIVDALVSEFNFCNPEKIIANEKKLIALLVAAVNTLKSTTDTSPDIVQLFLEEEWLLKYLQDLITTPKVYDYIFAQIVKGFCTSLEIENITGAERKLKKILQDIFTENEQRPLENLYYHVIGTKSNDIFKLYRINTPDFGFKINNTIITIFSKPGLDVNSTSVSPENVYDKFSSLISSAPHNFITLLSIEMRDRLKEDIRKIGVDISGIDEKAFFKHMDNYHSKNEFFDFLLKSWINDLSEYNLNLKPKVFSIISNYRQKNNLISIRTNDIIASLIKLGNKLSTINIPDRLDKDKRIRFGDIFQVFKSLDFGNEFATDQYFLSLTPHCICVDPNKIEDNFYFIKTKNNRPLELTAVRNIEKDFYSFIKKGSEEIIPVEWECKPFTLYIRNNNLNNLHSLYKNEKIKLRYVTTLKEVFAQRIANESFGYGTAIGIDLPH